MRNPLRKRVLVTSGTGYIGSYVVHQRGEVGLGMVVCDKPK